MIKRWPAFVGVFSPVLLSHPNYTYKGRSACYAGKTVNMMLAPASTAYGSR